MKMERKGGAGSGVAAGVNKKVTINMGVELTDLSADRSGRRDPVDPVAAVGDSADRRGGGGSVSVDILSDTGGDDTGGDDMGAGREGGMNGDDFQGGCDAESKQPTLTKTLSFLHGQGNSRQARLKSLVRASEGSTEGSSADESPPSLARHRHERMPSVTSRLSAVLSGEQSLMPRVLTMDADRLRGSIMTAPLGILSAPLVTTRNGRKTARNWTTDAPTTKAGLSQERARRLSALIHMGEGDTLVGQAGDADELWNALREHSVAHESNVAAHMHRGDGDGGGGGSGAGAGGGAFEGRQQKSRPRRHSAAVQAGVLFESSRRGKLRPRASSISSMVGATGSFVDQPESGSSTHDGGSSTHGAAATVAAMQETIKISKSFLMDYNTM